MCSTSASDRENQKKAKGPRRNRSWKYLCNECPSGCQHVCRDVQGREQQLCLNKLVNVVKSVQESTTMSISLTQSLPVIPVAPSLASSLFPILTQ